MFWRFILCVLVLSQVAESETSSNSSQKLQVQYSNSKENVSEGESSELLNGRNGSIYSPSSREGYSSQETKKEDKHLNISNSPFMVPDSENVQNGDIITKGEHFSQSEDSEDKRNVQLIDKLNDTVIKNDTQVPEFLPSFYDMQTHFDPDYWLQRNVSDGYDPKRTKKSKSIHKVGEVLKSSHSKSSGNFMNPTIGPLRTTEKSSVINKVDYLLERNMDNSHKRAGDVERNGLFHLEEQRSNRTESPSNSRFIYQDISFPPQLTQPAKVDVGYGFKYHPSTNAKLRSDSGERNDKDKIYQLKHLDNKKSSNHRGLQEFGEASITKSEEYLPVTLIEAEDRRKVTILKQKSVHSVSKEEEQETVNIHQNPVERLSEDDILAIETQSNNNDLLKPERQEKIEKREETIVLVEGTHIPGKNYGPEDDLFGYYTNSYDNLQPDSKNNQKLEITLSNGPSVQPSHKVRQNNHGDGFSSRYFVNHPKSSGNSHHSKLNVNDRFIFPPTNSPPRVTHEIRAVSVAEGEKSRNLPESYGKSHADARYQENGNNVHTAGNAQGSGHQDEEQYALVDVDPNQIYMDEKTGQLIKFVTEEEAEKLGVTAERQVENGHDGNSATYSQKTPEQNSHYGHLEDFSASPGSKGQAIDSKIFVNGGDNKEYAELTNADLSSHLPINKPRRKSKRPQFVTVNGKSSEFYVPMKDITSKSVSVSNSVSHEGSHGVQEDQGSYDVSSHSEDTRGKKPQFVAVNEKRAQFHVPAKDITAKPNFRSVSYEGSRGVQEDQGNYDVSGHSGGTGGTEYVVLYPETGDHAQHNQDYGKKLNFGSLGDTVTNPQSNKNDYHNNFKGSGDTTIEYEDDNGYKTSNDGFNHSENEDTYTEDNFETHGGNLENVGNFKGSTEGLHDTPVHGLLYDSQVGGKSVKTENVGNFKGTPGVLENAQDHGILYELQAGGKSVNTENVGNFKGTSGGLEDAQDHGILYELQAGGKSEKTDHNEIPLYKENMQLYKKDTESSIPSFPSKGDAVSTVYFSMVHHKAKNSRNPKRKKQNQNYIEFETPQNNFKGISQKQNGGSDMNSIHDHENFRISLQNLYGHNGGSLSFGKTQGSNYQNSGASLSFGKSQGSNYQNSGGPLSFGKTQDSNDQNSGYSKGNDNYLVPTGVNFNGKQLYEEVNLSPPQTSVKGSSESYNGNNIKSGFNFQNSRKPSGGYSSGLSGSGKGMHGGYKSNGITYSIPNENLQPNSNYILQNQFAGMNNVHQSEGPVEYVIVEEDDNNYESKGITEDPFLLEYENYKGNNGGLTSTNGLRHQPYEVKGSTTYSMEPNVRFVVDGGKDTTNRLRRLAATGFHMARGVLPYFPISSPRSVKGNVNFGLEINKRRGPAIYSQFL